MLSFTSNIFIVNAQDSTYVIKGKITVSDDGRELPGVTIKIKGTYLATMLKGGGIYLIEVPDSIIPCTLTYHYCCQYCELPRNKLKQILGV